MGNNFTPILLALALLLLPVQWESVSGSGLLCKEEERRALLHIKAELSCSFLKWEGKECCHWERVTCHSRTGHVIELDLRYPDGPHMINAYSLLLNATIFLPLRQLRSLSLSELGICDCVAGAGFESWSTLNKLKMLDLSYNELNRSIISSLVQVPSLRILDLEGNENMTGNVPVNEFSATNLEVVNLRDCGFNGSLPYLGDWSSLKAFSVSGNDLYGTITSTGLCRLKNLEELDLSYNNFAGTLPPWQIPRELTKLTSLEVFSVAYNNLSGPTLDLKAQFGTFDNRIYEGNPNLCGPPLSKSCFSYHDTKLPSQNKTGNDQGGESINFLILFGSFALFFVVSFWGLITVLYFKSNWRYGLFNLVDEYGDMIYVRVVLFVRKIRAAQRNN
ncbi:receptor like protein 9 [Rhynchospora pubera]|uniref:Receptor like protein 9 n=1 Tax=Rhynchospora pubera TaxID=906938 RepID=A0AAV8DMQ6_9POAL|nr:receptor like protein 9 [Rhynchospora pubera]